MAAEEALERARTAQAEREEAERRLIAARAAADSLAARGAKPSSGRKSSPEP
jgi:hypothetical protein